MVPNVKDVDMTCDLVTPPVLESEPRQAEDAARCGAALAALPAPAGAV